MSKVYSTDYLADDSPFDITVGFLHESIFLRKMEELRCNRIFAAISFPNYQTKYIAMNLTVDRDADRDAIYLPHWIIPSEFEIGEDVEIEFMSDEAFPEATKITLRPLDSAFYNTDVKEELTQSLTRIGLVQAGTIIQTRLSELGGYEMGFYIVGCEPTSLVLCSGDEVAIEFEEASDLWDGRPPTPIPGPDEVLQPVGEQDSMIPAVQDIAGPVGNVLGGEIRRMPDGRPWNPWRCIPSARRV